MSWSDVCSKCSSDRADCKCGDWNGYKKAEWLKQVQAEQNHYPVFKGRQLNETALLELYHLGKTPIDALNDLSTAA